MDKLIMIVFALIIAQQLFRFVLTIGGKPRGSSFTVGKAAAKQRPDDWMAVARATGLHLHHSHHRSSRLQGSIDGIKVVVSSDSRGPEIEVEFDSGIEHFDIRPFNKQNKTLASVSPVSTGDHIFDSQIRVLARDPEPVLSFLTPLRRETILALHSAVIIDEIDHDELEVNFPGDTWTPAELEDAIRLTVQVAKVLSSSSTTASPQDAVSPPQDAVSPSDETSSPEDDQRQ